jgi:hypothetical protein
MAKLSVMAVLSVRDASQRLSVSTRQVQNLVAHGDLVQLARGVLDEASVDRYLAVRGASRARAWSEPTAWGAIALLSGVTPTWMGTSQRSRLKARLRTLSAAELLARARNRADVVRYSGHPSAIPRIRAEIIDTSAANRALGLADSASVDGYVAPEDLVTISQRYGLARDDSGRFTLRAPSMDLTVVRKLAETDVVLAALDLSESLDIRERHAGLDGLGRALERTRD